MTRTSTKAAALLGGALLAATGLATAQGASAAPAAPVTVTAPTVVTAPSTSAVAKLSHAEATSRLRAAGIGWTSSGGCSDRSNPTCTSFEQVNLATIQGAVTLEQASGCALTITGGTETGHASGTYSHWNGYKLDFSPTSCLSGYITRTFTNIGPRPGDGAQQYRSGAGNIYARESNHWDVLFYNCGGC
ncbi:hypothetical protein HUT19_09725 [Streptomyces sp. NA02950]|uniref:hypothetical protein n=1 Tax=Streptomyces sp. NA02950 TaxID=2742137 RepID=UPI001590077D|nr:hypothetical protein [Streptomyces sp. NA02950]QKV91989.1 hypothetical protein HUT19_09725 [Streptomyces sp. NA02950]